MVVKTAEESSRTNRDILPAHMLSCFGPQLQPQVVWKIITFLQEYLELGCHYILTPCLRMSNWRGTTTYLTQTSREGLLGRVPTNPQSTKNIALPVCSIHLLLPSFSRQDRQWLRVHRNDLSHQESCPHSGWINRKKTQQGHKAINSWVLTTTHPHATVPPKHLWHLAGGGGAVPEISSR